MLSALKIPLSGQMAHGMPGRGGASSDSDCPGDVDCMLREGVEIPGADALIWKGGNGETAVDRAVGKTRQETGDIPVAKDSKKEIVTSKCERSARH